jgi:hypothetical protein
VSYRDLLYDKKDLLYDKRDLLYDMWPSCVSRAGGLPVPNVFLVCSSCVPNVCLMSRVWMDNLFLVCALCVPSVFLTCSALSSSSSTSLPLPLLPRVCEFVCL